MVTKRLQELVRPQKLWLYVDNSQESQEILKEAERFQQAGILFVSDLTGTRDLSDVHLPRLLRTGDVMSGQRLRRFIQFLKELDEEFRKEELPVR